MTRPTVLVVDDEPEMLVILSTFLGVDHRVLVAADVPSALALLSSEPCDLIVTDIRMPGDSGLVLVAWAQAQQLPLVVVSGCEPQEALDGIRWLAKPFRRAELLSAVQEGLASRG